MHDQGIAGLRLDVQHDGISAGADERRRAVVVGGRFGAQLILAVGHLREREGPAAIRPRAQPARRRLPALEHPACIRDDANAGDARAAFIEDPAGKRALRAFVVGIAIGRRGVVGVVKRRPLRRRFDWS